MTLSEKKCRRISVLQRCFASFSDFFAPQVSKALTSQGALDMSIAVTHCRRLLVVRDNTLYLGHNRTYRSLIEMFR